EAPTKLELLDEPLTGCGIFRGENVFGASDERQRFVLVRLKRDVAQRVLDAIGKRVNCFGRRLAARLQRNRVHRNRLTKIKQGRAAKNSLRRVVNPERNYLKGMIFALHRACAECNPRRTSLQ